MSQQRKKYSPLLLSLCLVLPCAFALDTDNQQPMHQEADYVTINRHTGVYIYIGHVKMRQGTAELQGDKVVCHVNKQNQMEEAIATGNPAHYQTLPEPNQKMLVATAKTMKYYPLQNKIILLGDGIVTQGNSVLTGEELEYDTKLKTVQSKLVGKTQTKIVIQPNALPHASKEKA